MNVFETALKTFFTPSAKSPVGKAFPTFRGGAATGSANLCVDTFNGTPLFTGASGFGQVETHTLGHLDTFV